MLDCVLMLRFFAAMWLAAATVAADTYPRQPGIDAEHYVFRLTLGDETDEIAGEATVTLRFLHDGVGEAALDLASPANGKGMQVTEVTSGGKAVTYTHQSDRLRISFDTAPHAGDLESFTISYHGVPAAGLKILSNKYGERCFFSENWPDHAHQWLPTIDHPYDKATSEFLVTASAKYQVVANGLLVEQTDLPGGRRMTHWKQSVPIASWLNALGVSPFAVRYFATLRGISQQTWIFPQDRDAGITAFEIPAKQAFEFYSDHIGPFAYEKLANVEAAGVSGGMEHASAIFYGEKSFGNKPATGLVAHEIAHQWFGDSVTEKDWDDVWLSEGFATYFTLLTTEHYEGRDAFVKGLKQSREAVFAIEKRNPGLAVRHDNLSDMKRVLNGLVYQKGGWTLHMLRGLIGTEKFWAGIRDYYHRFRDTNASTEDFRRVMEEDSGADLKWFFDQWLNRAGSPVVEGHWRYDDAAKKIIIDLAQKQPGGTYRLPLEIGIAASAGAEPKIEKIELTAQEQKFQIAADKPPAGVSLDPNTWVLMDARFQ